MRIVVDANVIFAALIKEGICAKLLTADCFNFYAPEFVLEEVEKYKSDILKKTARTQEKFEEIEGVIKMRVQIVPEDQLIAYDKKARKLTKDRKDWDYVASALSLKCGIWSFDKGFTNDKIKVYTTAEIAELFRLLHTPD